MTTKLKLSRSEGREFIADVKAGMTDVDLSKKYGLSGKNLVLYKIAVKDRIDREADREAFSKSRSISAKQLLSDIRSGLDNDELMLKHELSPRQLQAAFRQIIAAKLMTPIELANRLSITRSQVTEAFQEVQEAMKELE